MRTLAVIFAVIAGVAWLQFVTAGQTAELPGSRSAHSGGLAGAAIAAAPVPQPLRQRSVQRPPVSFGPLRVRLSVLFLLAAIFRLLSRGLWLLRLDWIVTLPSLTCRKAQALPHG